MASLGIPAAVLVGGGPLSDNPVSQAESDLRSNV